MASGQTLPAGQPVQIELSGLPHHPSWPRLLALAAAIVILVYGAWLAAIGPDQKLLAARANLEKRRAALLDDLVSVETQRAGGPTEGSKLEARRERLVAQLERVYAQLDHDLPGAAAPAAR
jgi:hypothetical protein